MDAQLLSNDNDLTLSAYYLNQPSELSALYPPISPDYFADKADGISIGEKNPFRKIEEWASTSKVVPYIRRVNLNEIGKDEFQNSTDGAKNAIEAGISIKF